MRVVFLKERRLIFSQIGTCYSYSSFSSSSIAFLRSTKPSFLLSFPFCVFGWARVRQRHLRLSGALKSFRGEGIGPWSRITLAVTPKLMIKQYRYLSLSRVGCLAIPSSGPHTFKVFKHSAASCTTDMQILPSFNTSESASSLTPS